MIVQSITQFQQLKLLGDRQRLAILRRLMLGPATLSQLGDAFHASPAHIRHHLKSLEQAGFVELDSTNPVRNLWEKYYRASAAAYHVNLLLLPEAPAGQTLLVIGSNDIAFQRLQADFSQKGSDVTPMVLALDSLDGLVKLREGLCQMATCHLLDPDWPNTTAGLCTVSFPARRWPSSISTIARKACWSGLAIPCKFMGWKTWLSPGSG